MRASESISFQSQRKAGVLTPNVCAMELLRLESVCSGRLNIEKIAAVAAQAAPNYWQRARSLDSMVSGMADHIVYKGRSLIKVDAVPTPGGSLISVYVKDDTDTETESGDERGLRIQLYVFRNVPAPLLFAWRFHVREGCFHAVGYSMLSGEILCSAAYVLVDHPEVTIKDLRELALTAAASKKTFLSQNQQIKMYLQGDVTELSNDGLLWNLEASTAPPRKRLKGKISLEQLRLDRWEDCLRCGLVQLRSEPSLLA